MHVFSVNVLITEKNVLVAVVVSSSIFEFFNSFKNLIYCVCCFCFLNIISRCFFLVIFFHFSSRESTNSSINRVFENWLTITLNIFKELQCNDFNLSLLNYLPDVPRTTGGHVPYVPRVLRAGVLQVPRALRALMPYVPRTLRDWCHTCSCASRAWCFTCLVSYVA